jgi:hypothetical protein
MTCEVFERARFPARARVHDVAFFVPPRFRAFDLLGAGGVDRVNARRTGRLAFGRGRSDLDGFCVWNRSAGSGLR